MARSAAREEFYADTLTTAVEGGINHWAIFGKIKRAEDLTVISVRVYVPESCDLCGAEDRDITDDEIDRALAGEKIPGAYGDSLDGFHIIGCKGHKITTDTIGHAFTVIGDKKKYSDIGLHPSYRSTYVAASFNPEDADLDAGDADNIVQIGLFEKVIFG